ncbi:hypothetical protein [Ralstonia thomasii]|uniref:hypothetical protein n=1 Tax=Ralstonia thomasii TaxID=3058596 RepID=UPI00292FE47E|nr:hypothetical protein [Ralstonia sp. LMG 18095]
MDKVNAVIDGVNSTTTPFQLGTRPAFGTATPWDSANLPNPLQVVGNAANVDGANGSYRNVGYTTGGVLRWNHGASGATEGGTNTGSDYVVQRFSDAGVAIDAPLSIARSTGVASFNKRPTFNANTPWDTGNLPAPMSASGGAFTGPVLLQGDPTSPYMPGTKQYIDAQDLLYAAREPDLIINPHGSIQQETTTPVAGPTNGANIYLADQWATGSTATGAVLSSGVTTGAVSNFDPCYLYLKTTTAKAALGAGDYYYVFQPVEGLALRKLLYGNPTARGSWLRFRASASSSGTASFAIRNSSAARSYVQAFAVTTTPTDFSFFIPGDTSGTWATNNTAAAYLSFCAGAGTVYQTATLGAWQTGNVFAASTQTNFLAAANSQLNITDVSWKPSQVLLPFRSIDYDLELYRCKRYWQAGNFFSTGYVGAGANQALSPLTLQRAMRLVVPASGFSLSGVSYNNASSAAIYTGLGSPSDSGAIVVVTGASAGPAYAMGAFTANARM